MFCFRVMISFEVDIMQLVLICTGLITNILKAGAASLLRSWGGNFACWDHYRQLQETRTMCNGKLWGVFW